MAESDPREEFRRLFETSKRDLLAQAYVLTGDRQEAQDLVQELFLRAWRSWPQIASADNRDAWLRRVLYNLAIGRWRTNRARLRRQRLTAAAGSSPAAGAEQLDVVRALQALPPRQREALVLVSIFDLTTGQAAREMNPNEGTVRVWVSRARTSLCHALGQDLEPAGGVGETDERA